MVICPLICLILAHSDIFLLFAKFFLHFFKYSFSGNKHLPIFSCLSMFNLFYFHSTTFFLLFQAVFEEQQCSLGMVGGELRLDGRRHLRANLKPGGKTHNMTSAVRAKTQRNKDFCWDYYDTKGHKVFF